VERLIAGAARLGLRLSPRQVEQFQLYYQELVEWNKRVNLTAIVDYEGVQVKHFLDSLSVTLALEEGRMVGGGDFRLLDVGAGAGLPGLPLKILYPGLDLVLLDSTAKKTAFLRHLSARLGLEDVEVETGRAEELAHQHRYREQFDVVVSRAVAALPSLVELTLPFCRVGGTFIAQKRGQIGQEIEKAARAIGILGGELREVRRVELEGLAGHLLVVVAKRSPTPQRYPRRPGIPWRRHL
jgi:16S rRNA (guanine527-N7)-methyltransferase